PTLKEFDDERGIIRGYANVYNIKDSDGDISLFGSFTKTVTERDLKNRVGGQQDETGFEKVLTKTSRSYAEY
ncbi:MAG: hypothetical protein PHG65_04305, partial [Kiritimatiellae bacterium]|nr:hypothetical protein [Kiritimatiellia bacterium]